MGKLHASLFVLTVLAIGCRAPVNQGDIDTTNNSFPLQFASPSENANLCGTATIEAMVSDAALPVEISFLIDGQPLSTVKEPPYWASLPTVLFAEGRHVLSLAAVDASKRTAGASRVIQIVRSVDCDNPPNIVFRSSTPTRASKFLVPLAVSASDDIGVVKVQYYFGTTLFAEVTQAPFGTDWDPRPFEAGTVDIKAVAFDTKGQTAVTARRMTIDRTLPVVTLTSPADHASVGSTVKLVATASAATEIGRVDFFVDGELAGRSVSWPYEATSTTLTVGSHTASAEAWDVLGNSAVSSTAVFTAGDVMNGCSSRCDCTGEGQICVAGKCQQAAVDGACVRDDQCPLGSVCDFSRKCLPGCAATCDCTGSKICNTTTMKCETCSRSNPCPAGQLCSESGGCEAVSPCSSNAQCTSGLVCTNGSCGFCARDADCAAYGEGFGCKASGRCALMQCSDASCQADLNSPLAYCDVTTNVCGLYQCVIDSDCFNGYSCQQHQCKIAPTCSEDCNGHDCASQGKYCDVSTCTCSTNPSNLCSPANAGVPVKADCTICACNDLMAGICVDAANTQYSCAPSLPALQLCQLGTPICE